MDGLSLPSVTIEGYGEGGREEGREGLRLPTQSFRDVMVTMERDGRRERPIMHQPVTDSIRVFDSFDVISIASFRAESRAKTVTNRVEQSGKVRWVIEERWGKAPSNCSLLFFSTLIQSRTAGGWEKWWKPIEMEEREAQAGCEGHCNNILMTNHTSLSPLSEYASSNQYLFRTHRMCKIMIWIVYSV